MLSDYERRGFAIFFYVTVLGHIEACMAEVIDRRLMYLRVSIAPLQKEPFKFANQPENEGYSTQPLHVSLRNILLGTARKLDKAPLDKLKEAFQEVFAVQLPGLLGDSHQDLNALLILRNLFAHGRSFEFEFEQTEANLLSLERHQLKLPAQRLFSAGVLSSMQFDAWNHHDFQRRFFEDDSMLYFLEAARQIEMKLKSVLNFEPELEMPLMVSLPVLTD